MDVSRLSKLFEAGNSGVKKFTKTLSVVVDRSHKDNWSLGAVLFLNSKLQQYLEGSDGVLLGYEDLTMKSPPSEPDADVDLHHVTIQAKLFVFSPEVGKCLSGKVVAKKKSSIVVAVHDYFQINVLSPKNIKKLEVGAQVSVKISSVVYVNGRPNMMGELDKAETNTLSSPGTSASVNGLSSPVKRKSEAQDKPKKKAKTSQESHEDGGSTTGDSDDDEQPLPIPKAPKTPAKTPKKSEAQDKSKKKAKTSVSQSQDDVEEIATAEEQSPSKPPKTPGKTPKAQKSIPDGFTWEEKTRPNGRVDKEYVGPDGKRYRSINEIYKKNPELGPGESSDPQEKLTTEDMKEQVDEVATNWNKGEDGSMNKNKNKFYSSVGLKKLPKTERHFTDAKAKKGKHSKEVEDNGDTEEAEEETVRASSSTSIGVRDGNKASVTISDTDDIKKKKKKKKNKENDKTI